MIDKKFKELYSEIGLIDEKGKILTLHSTCKYCNNCWQDIEDRKPGNDGFWTITKPWVGKNYEKLKLLVVGINMNEYGSYDGAVNLVEQAKKEYELGYTKNFVSETYKGTFLFHRMTSYVNAIIEKESIYTPNWINSFPSKQDLIKSFDLFAYTNQIKCSPVGEKSKPTYQMWENCGNYILKNEINLLKPNKILVLGDSDNFSYLNNKVLDDTIHLKWKGNVGIGNGYVNKNPIDIIVVPHPASFGGNSYEIMNDINCVINNRC